MSPHAVEHLSAGRARRDVQAIRASLAALAPGDLARVVVRSPRYGVYVVDGVVRLGTAGQPMIADLFLGPGSEIQRIETLAELADAAPPAESADEASELAHGTAVRVTFSTPTHGGFAITGPLTAGDDDFLLVGSWIVAEGERIAPRVVGVQTIADVEIHPANLPPRRSRMEESGTSPVEA